MMILFPKINKRKTKKNVHQLLSQYHRFVRLSLNRKAETTDSDISVYSRKVQVLNELDKINFALDQLEENDRLLLRERYMNSLYTTNIALYMNFHMSESKFYRELDKALICFAEAYENGELLVED